jgi:hypothetical protein
MIGPLHSKLQVGARSIRLCIPSHVRCETCAVMRFTGKSIQEEASGGQSAFMAALCNASIYGVRRGLNCLPYLQ